MVGVIVRDTELFIARRRLRSLLLPSQERLHFRTESQRRKLAILEKMSTLDLKLASAWVPSVNHVRDARQSCLLELLVAADLHHVQRVSVELEQSALQSDLSALRGWRRRAIGTMEKPYSVTPSKHDELLWIPDAFAWCLAAGGTWRRAIEASIVVEAVLQ